MLTLGQTCDLLLTQTTSARSFLKSFEMTCYKHHMQVDRTLNKISVYIFDTYWIILLLWSLATVILLPSLSLIKHATFCLHKRYCSKFSRPRINCITYVILRFRQLRGGGGGGRRRRGFLARTQKTRLRLSEQFEICYQ